MGRGPILFDIKTISQISQKQTQIFDIPHKHT